MAPNYRISLVSLLALGIAMPAMAQETPAAAATPAEAGPQERERDVIVVTANKREESVQDIAVAVTAVTSEMRDELGITSVTDLTNLTPGLSYTASNERITLRGIGRNTNNFGAEPGVANYTDGIYQSFASIAGRDNLFIDRIEVLRGPQGTLYGRNSIGGALNTISKRPTDEFQAEGVIGFGNLEQRKVGASFSGPITDDIRGRVVGVKEVRDEGTFLNLGTGETEGFNIDNYNWEVQLEGDIGDRLSWWTKYTTGGYHNAGPPGGRTTGNSLAPYDTFAGSFGTPGGVTPNPYWAFSGSPVIRGFTQTGNTRTNPTIADPRTVNSSRSLESNLDGYNDAALEIIYAAGPFDIKYVGGYINYDYNLYGDQDGSPVTSITYLSNAAGAPSATGTPRTIFPDQTLHYNETRAFFSNEVNFISTTDGPFQWIAGLYAYQENFKQPVQTFFKDEPLANGTILRLGPTFNFQGLAAANPTRQLSYTNNIGLNNSYGVYGQGDYSFNDEWKATLGVRYSIDNKHIQEEARLFCFVVCGGTYADVTQAVYNGVAPGVTYPQPGVASATAANPTGVTYNVATGISSRLLDDEWSAITGTAGLEWTPTNDTLLFGRYSRGYKTGGFNATDMAPLPRTNPEKVDSYELGWKQEFNELNLTSNVALFFYDYRDVQIPVTVQPATGPTYSAFVNIPKVETSGLEVESTWSPIDNLNVRFTYAYLKSEIAKSDTYVNALTGLGQNVEGNTLPQAPEHKVAANVGYTFEFQDGSTLLPSLSWYWRDSFTTSIFNNPETFTPDYAQTDARLIWNDADGRFTVIGFVRNAFDEEGYDAVTAARRRSANPAENGKIYQTNTLTLPRTYGIELQFHWR